MDFEEAKRLVAQAKAAGLIKSADPVPLTPHPSTQAPPSKKIIPLRERPRSKVARSSRRTKLTITCRWCGFEKSSYSRCPNCNQLSNTWSAKKAAAQNL